jgi:hypothetical protein
VATPADVRRLHLIVALVALVTLAAGGRATAQSVADLSSGARVRITLPDSVPQAPLTPKARSVIGTLARVTADTLWLHVAGPDTLRVPRATLRRIEVSRGRSRSRSAMQQGLLMGLSVGGIGVARNDGEIGRDAVGTAALGAVLGALLGALQPYEHWRTVR